MGRIGAILVAISLLHGVGANPEMGNVKRVGATIVLSCPLSPIKSWGPPEKLKNMPGEEHMVLNYSESNNGQYYCESSTEKYTFYVRVKVCEGCIELDAGTVAGIVCGDLVVTFLVALSVYCFAKRRGVTKEYRNQQHGAPDIPMGRGTNMAASHQQSDYAPIKSGQRDLYDRLSR